MTKYPCPKCGSKHSWFEQEDDALLQRCLCGLMHYLFREMEDGTTVMRSGVRVQDVALPRNDTKIYKCLLAVRNAFPKNIRTGDIAEKAGLKGKETASLVVTLMGRGLLERVTARRGLLGGSVWKLTLTAQTLLKVDKGVNNYGTSAWYAGGEELLPERHSGGSRTDIYSEEGEPDSSWFNFDESDDWP